MDNRLKATKSHANHATPQFRVPENMLTAELWVALTLLKSAAYNPVERSCVTSNQRVLRLAASHLKTGTHGNVWVTKPGEGGARIIIDGHRTVTALAANGYTHALCREYRGDPHQLFGLVNEEVKVHQTNQKLREYLVNKMAVSDYVRPGLIRMESVVGRKVMKEVASRGGSRATFTQAEGIADYCDFEGDAEFITKALLWLTKWKGTRKVRQYIDGKGSAMTLFRAVSFDWKLCG